MCLLHCIFFFRMNNFILVISYDFLYFDLVVRIISYVVMFWTTLHFGLYDFIFWIILFVWIIGYVYALVAWFVYFVSYFDMLILYNDDVVTIFMLWTWFVVLHSIFVMIFDFSPLDYTCISCTYLY